MKILLTAIFFLFTFNIQASENPYKFLKKEVLLGKASSELKNDTRSISKKDMVLNDVCPTIDVNPETYEVRANGEIITCEPAEELPMAQRYFMY